MADWCASPSSCVDAAPRARALAAAGRFRSENGDLSRRHDDLFADSVVGLALFVDTSALITLLPLQDDPVHEP